MIIQPQDKVEFRKSHENEICNCKWSMIHISEKMSIEIENFRWKANKKYIDSIRGGSPAVQLVSFPMNPNI